MLPVAINADSVSIRNDRLTVAANILANLLSNDNIIDLYSSEDQRENTCKWALAWADTLIKVDNAK